MILLVDDDPSIAASLELLLRQAGYQSVSAATPAAAMEVLRRQPCQLVIQDMNFSRRTTGEEGLELLRSLKRERPHTPVVLITAWGSIDLAVEGMKSGAADFITKPWNQQHLLQTIATAIGLESTRASQATEPLPTRESLDETYDFGHLVGQSPEMLRLLQLVGRVAETDASVLITGESGTGKELIAEALHRNSRRARRAFVKVNLGGVPASLFESEMFGHVRGAFTDAHVDRQGRFALSHGGTIFLDEIGDLDLGSQVKMLRVLQDRSYEVLGSSQRREVDVRVVSATNRPLAEMVARGEFREDLLYRINLISAHLPPLRERASDIPMLAGRLLGTAAEVYGRAVRFSSDAVRWLQVQPWPGNVRQLKQWIERAVLVGRSGTVDVADFADMARMDASGSVPDPLPAVGSMTLDEIERGDDSQVDAASRGQHQPGGRIAGTQPCRALPAIRKVRDPGVSLRARLISYLFIVHLLAAVLAVYLFRQSPYWLLPVEAAFLISFAVGWRLVRSTLEGLAIAARAVQLIGDEEFTSRFRPLGDPHVDTLIAVYNRMVDTLRHERARVEEQQHFFDQVIRVSPAGVIVLDFDGRVAEINPAAERLLDLRRADAVGKPLGETGATLASRLEALTPGKAEVLTLAGPRRVRCYRGTFIDRGCSRRFFLVDELTGELRQVERGAYEKLIRVMSHEVNNTVTAASSLLQSVRVYGHALAPAEQEDFDRALAIVIERAGQLRVFVSRFADVFRLPAPAMESCSLRQTIEPLVRLLSAQPGAADITWRWDDIHAESVWADRAQLEQVCLNVLKNAVEAAGPSGEIVIRVSNENGRAVLVIDDNGPGPTADQQAHVFTPFFTTKQDGQGIGLTLVQEILSAHGASCTLEHPTGGPTRFTVRF